MCNKRPLDNTWSFTKTPKSSNRNFQSRQIRYAVITRFKRKKQINSSQKFVDNTSKYYLRQFLILEKIFTCYETIFHGSITPGFPRENVAAKLRPSTTATSDNFTFVSSTVRS